MEDSKEDIRSLAGEKRRIEATLTAAGGPDFSFLLDVCADLAGLIEEIREVSSQRSQKEHAAFYTKVKFSRKIRRKSKDLNRFEQGLVPEYGQKHITFGHGKKMAIIVKHLRMNHVEEAELEAGEFYELLEMGARLETIDDLLSRKRAQVERARRAASAQLSDLEQLENEPPPDQQMVGRHDEKAQLDGMLADMWSGHAQSLKSMPMAALLGKMLEEGPGLPGFPQIPAQDAESMAAFLQKSGLGSKSAAQLHEMTGQSEQRLRHFGVDCTGFRQEVAARREFLLAFISSQPAVPPALGAGSPALAYLSERSPEARKAALRLTELGKTAEADGKEWERAERMKQTKARLEGVEKSALLESIRELGETESILDGKAWPAQGEEGEKAGGEAAKKNGEDAIVSTPKNGKGIIESIMGFFGGSGPARERQK